MFNAERLLGKVLQEVIGTGTRHKGNSLLGSLSSGGGLMTVIGLGVGAMEIFKDKQQQAPAGGYSAQPYQQPPPPPQPPGTSASHPNWARPAQPPPPPQPQVSSPAAGASQGTPAEPAGANTEELAIRLIQVMIAAAHADGTLDPAEEQAILERAGKAGLSPEERLFFLDELHKPKSIPELTAGITDPSVARTMYLLAAGTIAIDTETERNWLDQLAAALGLSKAVQSFIEDQG